MTMLEQLLQDKQAKTYFLEINVSSRERSITFTHLRVLLGHESTIAVRVDATDIAQPVCHLSEPDPIR